MCTIVLAENLQKIKADCKSQIACFWIITAGTMRRFREEIKAEDVAEEKDVVSCEKCKPSADEAKIRKGTTVSHHTLLFTNDWRPWVISHGAAKPLWYFTERNLLICLSAWWIILVLLCCSSLGMIINFHMKCKFLPFAVVVVCFGWFFLFLEQVLASDKEFAFLFFFICIVKKSFKPEYQNLHTRQCNWSGTPRTPR